MSLAVPLIPSAPYYWQLSHLSSISIIGDDSVSFLQGQLTCDVRKITENQAGIGAFCNAKGRAITLFILLKIPGGFLMVLPSSLQDKVLKKLQIFVLRAKVRLSDANKAYNLYGTNFTPDFPTTDLACQQLGESYRLKLPSTVPLGLTIHPAGQSAPFPTEISMGDTQVWRYLEISAGLPWFEADHSEQFIPQMLNLDILGGISFDKGCYTGQEIVARTHYLGKNKRQLQLAECDASAGTDSADAVIDADSGEKCGDIIAAQALADNCRMLIVLQSIDGGVKNLILNNHQRTQIKLLPLDN